ncbi:hypothetical protein BH09BAC3_BH09BAC3_23580 [soil metagenome]
MKHPLLVLLLFSVFCSYSQESRKDSLIAILDNSLYVDSLRLYSPKYRTFDFQLDNRNSFIRNRAINIWGINGAIIINQRFRYGLGIYRVVTPFAPFTSLKKSSISDSDDLTERQLDMFFVMPNFRYMFIHRKWVRASLEAAIGFGAVNYNISYQPDSAFVKKYGTFIPAGAGVELVLIPYRYIGLMGSIGYRKSLKTYDINADFDGMYYSYGVSIFVGTILKDIRYKKWKKEDVEKIRKIRAMPR